MKNAKVNIVKDATNPEPTEIIAQSIIDLSDGMNRIIGGKLNKRALLVLLKDASGVSMGDIEKVLTSMSELRRQYTKS